jgi:RNA polymerase sigma-70 factor (ECF subfamily)
MKVHRRGAMPNSDFEIIQRILAGETRAYAELVDRHKDRAMTLAMRMLKNREDAEEALQDAFVRAFKALDRFEMKASFATWFYRIVFNVCSSALGKRQGTHDISIDEDNLDAALSSPPAGNPEIEYDSSEFQRSVHEEIERMAPAYGAILTLFFIQELGYEEIVEVTGLPLGTVKNRLFRARMMLRQAVLKRMRGGMGERESGRLQQEIVQ